MAATIKDVAKEAGVSIKTVSRVVNGESTVAEKTRVKVETTIQRLGYRPNVLARGLVSGRSHLLAVLVPQISDPFYQDFIRGAEAVARVQGFRVLLCYTVDDAQQELDVIEELTANRVEGIVLCGSRLTGEQLQEIAQQHQIVAITGYQPEGVSVLRIPAEAGLDATTSYLIDLGHQRIGYLGLERPGRHEWRSVGYQNAMKRAGLSVDDKRVVKTRSQTVEDGYAAAQQLLQQAPDTTAVACYNDLMAVGAVRAFKDAGRDVPKNMAVVGFGDLQLASWVTPSLTTMHVPRVKMGEEAIEMLLDVLKNKENWSHRDVDVSLVVRESCGGPIDS